MQTHVSAIRVDQRTNAEVMFCFLFDFVHVKITARMNRTPTTEPTQAHRTGERTQKDHTLTSLSLRRRRRHRRGRD